MGGAAINLSRRNEDAPARRAERKVQGAWREGGVSCEV